MRGAWLYRREETARQRLLLTPLLVVSWFYALGGLFHRHVWSRWREPRRLSCRVVSVGGITVGGSGKTPSAAWLARELHRRGTRTALATRGYARAGRESVRVVSDGRHVRADVKAGGDEPLLLAAHAPGVPVLVGADRAVVGLRALALFGTDTLVLDDGFQHHRLARDVDLVVLDGALGFGNRKVLPRGPLREPAGALRSADAVLVVDGPLPGEDEELLARLAPDAPLFAARRHPTVLRSLAGGSPESPAVLHGRDVGIFAGIANPASLRHTVEGLGARVSASRAFPDHHRYRPSDLDGLSREAPLWITTEKDAVKILPPWVGEADVRVLVIGLRVLEDERLLALVEARLR